MVKLAKAVRLASTRGAGFGRERLLRGALMATTAIVGVTLAGSAGAQTAGTVTGSGTKTLGGATGGVLVTNTNNGGTTINGLQVNNTTGSPTIDAYKQASQSGQSVVVGNTGANVLSTNQSGGAAIDLRTTNGGNLSWGISQGDNASTLNLTGYYGIYASVGSGFINIVDLSNGGGGGLKNITGNGSAGAGIYGNSGSGTGLQVGAPIISGFATGIDGHSSSGVTITTTGGSIGGATIGINAASTVATGTAVTISSGSAITVGSGGTGISASSGGGAIGITTLAGGTISGGAYGINASGGAATLSLASSVAGTTNSLLLGAFNDSLTLNSGATLTGAADLGAGTNTLTLTGAGTTDTLAVNALANATSLTKTGTGTWTLTGNAAASDFTGTTTISAGTLIAGSNGELGTGAVVDNATLAFVQTTSGSVGNGISGTGVVSVSGLASSGGPITFNGALTNDGGLALGTDGYVILNTSISNAQTGGAIQSTGVGNVIGVAQGGVVTYTGNANLSGAAIHLIASGTVNNLGLIQMTGSSGQGLILDAGGTINNGSTTNTTARITTTGSGAFGSVALFGGNATSTVNNYGELDGSAGGLNQYSGTGALVVNNLGTGSLITSGYDGIDGGSGGLTVANAGKIVGGSNGVYSASTATITNTGTIATGTVDANGNVTVGGAGFAVDIGSGTVTNSGTLQSGGAAVYQTSTTGTLNLVNTGIIGSLTSTGAPHNTDPDDTVVATGAATIFNSGTIATPNFYAVDMQKGGTLTNAAAGQITAGTADNNRFGVFVTGASGTINNYGSITSTSTDLKRGIQTDDNAATINLYAGSTTGAIATGAGDDTLTLYNGTGTANAGLLYNTVTGVTSAGGTPGANQVVLQAAGVNNAAALAGTVDLGGGTNTLTLAGAGTYDGVNGANTTGARGTLDISTVANVTNLVKQDSGTWVLSGIANYGGTTTISGGTLVDTGIGPNQPGDQTAISSLGNGPVSIASGATLQIDNQSGSQLYLKGGSFTGAGTIAFTGNAGALTALGYGGNGNVYIALSPGGLIDVQSGLVEGSTSNEGFYTSSDGTVINQGSLNIAAGATFDGVEANVYVDKLTGAGTLAGGYGNSGSTTIGTANGSATFDGVIANSSNGAALVLTKTGTGTQTLTGANTYTGATTISGGTLALLNGGSIANSRVVANANLDISGVTGTVSGIDTINKVDQFYANFNGSTTAGSAATLNYQAATYHVASTIAFTDAAGIVSDVLTFDANDNQVFYNVLSGNSLIGTSCAASGTLACLQVTGSTQDLIPTIKTLNSNQGVFMDGTSTYTALVGDIYGTGIASIVSLAGTGTVTLGTKTLALSNASDTFSGSITGTGGLMIQAGTEVLGGIGNTYSGTTTIASGATLQGTAATLSSNSAITDNGTLAFVQGNAGGTYTPGISGSGRVTVSGTGAGTLIFAGGDTQTGGFVVTDASKVSFSGSNTGAATEVTANVAGATIGNTGTITGTNRAITLSAGGTVTNTGGAIAQTSTANTDGNAAVYSNGNLSLTNSGTISTVSTGASDGATILGVATVNNSGTITAAVASGLAITASGSIVTNSGTIQGGTSASFGDGIALVGGTITNNANGVITGSLAGVSNSANALTINNAATATIGTSGAITATNGVQVSGGPVTLNNSGVVRGGTRGVYETAGAVAVVNTGGTIVGGTYGVYGTSATDTVTNSGTIASGTYNAGTGAVALGGTDGVYLGGGGTVTNNAGGLIEGATQGVEFAAAGGRVNNAGTITSTGSGNAVADFNTNSTGVIVANSGTINFVTPATGAWGVALYGTGTNVVTNTGTISADEGIELRGTAATTLVNGQGGQITGTTYGIQTSGAGVLTFTNYGMVTGPLSVLATGAQNLSLQAGSTTGAITTGTGADTLSLYTGSITTTDVIDPTTGLTVQTAGVHAPTSFGTINLGGGANTLNLRGPGTYTGTGANTTGAVNSIDLSTVTGAGTITKQDMGTWTLTGAANATVPAGGTATAAARINAGTGAGLGGEGILAFVNTTGLTGPIYVNGAQVQVSGNGALGTGVVHMVDPNLTFTTTSTQTNAISLDVARPGQGSPSDTSNDPSTFAANAGVVGTLSGAITTGTGNNANGYAIDPVQPVVIAGAGTVVLTNAGNAWTGVTTINQGATLRGTTASLSGGSFADNGTLNFNQGAAGTSARAIGGTGVVLIDGGGAVTLSGPVTVTGGALAAGGGAVQVGANTTLTLTNASGSTRNEVLLAGAGTTLNTVAGGTIRSVNGNAVYSNVANNMVNNAGTLAGNMMYTAVYLQATTGANTVTNAATGTISGYSAIYSGGTLALTNNGMLTGITGNAVFAGGAGNVIVNNATITGVSTGTSVAGAIGVGGASTITNNAGATISGNRGIAAGGTTGGTTVNNHGQITGIIDNAVSLFAGGAVTNFADGTLTATHAGGWGVYVSAGATTIDNQGAINADSGIVSNSAIVPTVTNEGTINAAVNGVWGLGTAVNLTNTGTINAGTTGVRAEAAGSTITNAGTIAGSAPGAVGVYMTGGTLTNQSGGVISAGQTNGAYGTAIQLAGMGNMLNLQAGSTVNGSIDASGTTDGSNSYIFSGALNGGFTGGSGNDMVTLVTPVTVTGTLDGGAGTDTLVLDGTGMGALNSAQVVNFENGIKQGTGTSTLTGTTAASPTAFTINAGTLNVAGGNALADNGAVVINAGGTLGLLASETIGSLAGAGNVALGANTLTTGGLNASPIFSGVASGTGGLTKVGTGTLTLSGANTYTGATAVNAGTLVLGANNAIAAGSAVTIASGATLNLATYNDTVASLALNGTLNGSGTLTAATYTLNGATVNGNLGAGTLIQAGGASMLNGTSNAGVVNINAGTLMTGGAERIADNAAVTIASGATLSLGGAETIGSLAGAGNVAMAANTLTTGGLNASPTFSGVASGTGGLTKAGTGTLTLSGVNTYTGATTINAGTLAVSGDGSIASSMVVDNATFDISGHTGGTSIAGLSGTGGVTLGANTLSLTNGGSYAGVASGTGGLTVAAGNETLTGNNSYTGTTTVSGGNLTLGNGGTTGSVAGPIALASGVLTINHSNAVALTGAISGSGSLVQAGTGTTTLSGVNTYTGTTTINAGTLAVSGGAAIADVSAVTVNAGGTLQLNNSETVGSLGGSGNVVLGANTLTTGGLNASPTFSGVASGTGGLTKVGTGTLTLSGANTYTGATAVNAGTLALGANNTLSAGTAVSVATGATFNLATYNDTVASLGLNGTLNGTGTLTAATYSLNGATVNGNLGAGTLTNVGGTSALNGTEAALTFNVMGGTLSLGASDRLADAAAVAVATGATLNLAAFSDTVTSALLNGTLAGTGTLTAASYTLNGATVNGNLGTGMLVQNSGTSTLTGTTNSGMVLVMGGALALGASNRIVDIAMLGVASGATFNLGAFSDTVGTAVINGTLAGTGTLTAASYTLNGAAVNANLGTGTLVQNSGVSVLSGTTATTAVNLAGGSLRLGASDRIVDTAVVTIGSGATFDLAGYNETIGTLVGGGAVSLGAGTLTTGGNNVDTAYAGVISGTGDLTKTGTATLTLSGANTLTGRLNANAGTLQLLGSTAGSVRVQGGTLAGVGQIAGNLLVSSGTLSVGTPAQAIGSMSAGSLTVTGGTSVFDFSGSTGGFTADRLNIAGAVNLSGGLVSARATEATANYRVSQTYTLIQAGSVTGTYANANVFTQTANNTDLYYRLRYDLTPGSVVLEVRKQIDFTAGLAAAGASGNQLAVGAALNGSALMASDAYANVLNAIQALDAGGKLAAYNSISGEGIADISTSVGLMNQRFTELLRRRLATAGSSSGDGSLVASLIGGSRGLANARASGALDGGSLNGTQGSSAFADGTGGATARGGAWVQSFGGYGLLRGQAGSANLYDQSYGIAAGIDGRLGPVIVGVAGSGAGVDTRVTARATKGNGTIYQGAGYAAYDDGRIYANAIGTYFSGDVTSRRSVFIGASQIGVASGKSRAHGFGGSLSVGYRIDLGGGTTLTPQGSIEATRVTRDAFTETGVGVLNLAAAKQRRDLYQGTAEGRLSHGFALGGSGGTVEPYVGAGFAANWGNRAALDTIQITGAPTGTGLFAIDGANLAKYSAVISGGIDGHPSDRVTLGVGLQTHRSPRQKDGAVQIHAKIAF